MKNNFKIDLPIGEKIELKVINWLCEKDLILLDRNKNNKYDFLLNNNKSYEVKYDRKAHISGNLAIEYYCYNKPSGIYSTISDFYIFYIKNGINSFGFNILFFETKDLKELISINVNNSHKRFESIWGGDNNKSKFFLIPVGFLEYFAKNYKI